MAKRRKTKSSDAGLGGVLVFLGLAGAGGLQKYTEGHSSGETVLVVIGIVLILVLIVAAAIHIRKTAIRKMIQSDFDSLSGVEFESFCQQVLLRSGFSSLSLTKGSGDFGADLIGTKNGVRFAIQCKRYTRNIGIRAVQEAASGKAYYGCDMAAVITNRYFTKAAAELAAATGVELIDRDRLAEMVSHCRKAM